MPPVFRLGEQIAEVAAALDAIGVRFALIGGLALASYIVMRATQDVDFVIDAVRADEAEAEPVKLGYRRQHRSADAAIYAPGDERIDFIYAHRRIARELLASSENQKAPLGDLHILNAARLLQFSKSVEPPFAAEGGLGAPVSAGEDPYQTLDELMVVVEALCPVWSPRAEFLDGDKMLL